MCGNNLRLDPKPQTPNPKTLNPNLGALLEGIFSILVIKRTLLRITEDLVRIAHLFEHLFCYLVMHTGEREDRGWRKGQGCVCGGGGAHSDEACV
jgi:hypothetical protein